MKDTGLSENSKITIGLAIALFGGIAWLTSLHLQSESNASEIKEIKSDVRELREMKTDVTVIKSDLKRVLKKMGEE